MSQVLVVEDSAEFQQVVEHVLSTHGWTVDVVGTLAEARSALADGYPEVVILDLTLPDGDGLDLCREIRARGNAGILLLTGRTSDTDMLLGFGAGADDYLRKPFSPDELRVRLTALHRRSVAASSPSPTGSTVTTNGISVDPHSRRVEVDGVEIDLTKSEFDLLHELMSHAGNVIGRQALLSALDSGDWSDVSDHTLTVHIGNLRRKLASSPCSIDTVRGIGYRLQIAETASH